MNRKTGKPAATKDAVATPLPDSMATGKASAAKAAVGDAPVFAYIASLPQPQRGIVERIDLLAASTLPGGADYFIPTWYQLFGLIVYPALAAAALDWLWAVGRQLAKKKQ